MSKKPHIFIEADSISTDKMSGIGHATLEIIRAFDNFFATGNNRQKLTIIVPFGKKKFVKSYGFKNASIRSLPPGYRYVNFALTRTSMPIPVDLLYGKGVYIFPNYKTWWLLFSKSITFVDDVAFKIYPETINPKNLSYLNANIENWLRRADKIIAISEASRSELSGYFSEFKDKVETVRLGIDPTVFYPRNKNEVTKALKKYVLPKRYFLFVGNLEPRKNLINLLNAYKKYSDSNTTKTPLILIGADGWQNSNIYKRITQLKKTGYSIYMPSQYVLDGDLPAIYTGATALIQVSIHEGFGLPPLQATVCGTPTIVSDIPVFREILNNFKNVYYVNPQDIDQIVSSMFQAEHLIRIRHKISTDLTWQNSVENLYKVIDTVG